VTFPERIYRPAERRKCCIKTEAAGLFRFTSEQKKKHGKQMLRGWDLFVLRWLFLGNQGYNYIGRMRLFLCTIQQKKKKKIQNIL
jgi:hypothetical protein